MNGLRLFRIEARRSVALWLAPLVIGAAWLLARNDLALGVILWPHNSVLARDSVFFAGPLAAGAGAWMAGRDRRHGMGELLFTTPHVRPVRDALIWLATGLWIVAAYLLAGVIILGFTALRASWGEPVLWPLATGFLALLTCAALGYLLGRTFSSRFTAPLVAVGVFLVQIGVGYILLSNWLGMPGWLAALSPIVPVHSSVWYGVRPNIGPGQSLFFLGLTGLILALLAAHDVRDARGRVAGAGAILLPAAVMLAGVGLLRDVPAVSLSETSWSPRWSMIPYEPVCDGEPVAVCVHPAYRAVLPDLVPAVESMTEPLAGASGAPRRVEQAPEMPLNLTGPLAGESSAPQVIPIRISTYTWAGFNATYDVAAGLVSEQPDSRLNDAQAAIKAWLLRRAGVEIDCSGRAQVLVGRSVFTAEQCAAAARFAELDGEVQRRWFETQLPALRKGQLGPELLP
ncbi:MAG: ABC transporter permease [Chloroflexi bacterium]|nr:ABC transporter permease [Chloroflexota bacterium]